jgi:hypothetical protein
MITVTPTDWIVVLCIQLICIPLNVGGAVDQTHTQHAPPPTTTTTHHHQPLTNNVFQIDHTHNTEKIHLYVYKKKKVE